MNIALDDQQWIQASLPVNDGGLEIRSVGRVAPSTFLASASAAVSLTTAILSGRFASIIDSSITQAFEVCTAERISPLLLPPPDHPKESDIDRSSIGRRPKSYLVRSTMCRSTVSSMGSHLILKTGWISLNAPPLTAAGFRMSSVTILIVTGMLFSDCFWVCFAPIGKIIDPALVDNIIYSSSPPQWKKI